MPPGSAGACDSSPPHSPPFVMLRCRGGDLARLHERAPRTRSVRATAGDRRTGRAGIHGVYGRGRSLGSALSAGLRPAPRWELLLVSRDRQAPATLAATLRAHALAKAVGAEAAGVMGLIRALHGAPLTGSLGRGTSPRKPPLVK